MEFEDLDEKIKREARRIAAAFGATEWRLDPKRELEKFDYMGFHETRQFLNFRISHEAELEWVAVKSAMAPMDPCFVRFEGIEMVRFSGLDMLNELMARGLYRLGTEGTSVVCRLDHPLTAHEKLELRLSMPREFWPKKWIDEEAGQSRTP